eukprot:scaffold13231_cov145-Amphora_coffeaeformis.AAC.2
MSIAEFYIENGRDSTDSYHLDAFLETASDKYECTLQVQQENREGNVMHLLGAMPPSGRSTRVS